uniref:G_PROTEIN_RECEP_F1_2 domain-containing protein n=2 Tax=Steinernema glaseri TaxID=37863 RepID=A0A1I8AT21_9BILA
MLNWMTCKIAYRENLTGLLQKEGICDQGAMEDDQLFELNKLLEDNMFCSTKNAAQNITPFMENYALASVLAVCNVDPKHWGIDNGYRRLFNFLFQKRNTLREELCQKLADEHRSMITDCNSAVRFNTTWGNRCKNAEQVYGFSWYFLRVVQKEHDRNGSFIHLFGDEFVNDRMIEDNNLEQWFVNIDDQMNDRTFEDPRTEIFETYVDGISLIREAMKTPLILNNFGLSVRMISRFFGHYCQDKNARLVDTFLQANGNYSKDNTKYMMLECFHNSSNRENDTLLRYFDFEPLISMQNLHNFCYLLLILLSYGSNIYAKAVLFAARKTMDSTTFLLIKILFNSNMITITTNLWSIIREHIPIEEPFEAIEQFPSSFFNPDFQQNITFLVARTSLSATFTYSETTAKRNITVHIANALSVVNNGVQSLSQSMGAIVLLVIMCLVLYELRISFCGRLSSRHFHWCRYVLYVVCVVIAIMHVVIAAGQFCALNRLNVLKQEGRRSTNLTEYKHVLVNTNLSSQLLHFRCKEAKRLEDQVNLKIHMVFLIAFNVAAVVIVCIIIAYHQLIIIRTPLQIPNSTRQDMSHAIKSILLATFVYIIANGGLTYIAAYLLLSECIDEECISSMTLAYHWTRLLCLADPIIHPIIIIRRLRGMLAVHENWKQYGFFTICKKCTGKPFRKVVKIIRFLGNHSSASAEKQSDDTVHKKKNYALDIDLQTLLKILEDEKKGIREGDINCDTAVYSEHVKSIVEEDEEEEDDNVDDNDDGNDDDDEQVCGGLDFGGLWYCFGPFYHGSENGPMIVAP